MDVMTLAVVSILGIIQVAMWVTQRLFVRALFGAVFCLVYPIDLIYIQASRYIYLTPSENWDLSAASKVGEATIMVVVAGLVFFVGLASLPKRSSGGSGMGGRKIRLVVLLTLGIGLSFAVFLRVWEVGLETVLRLRQQIFGDDLFLLLAYYVLPVLVPFGAVGLLRSGPLRRLMLVAAIATALVASFATGSRSGLFLGSVLPTALLLWRLAGARRGLMGDASRLTILIVTGFSTVLGGAWYLSEFRGVASEGSLLGSVDVSQADVLVSLISADAAPLYGSSYLAGFTTLVPRAWWAAKPLPGNVEASVLLTPDRYEATGAEITSGLLGEAFLNFGLGGALFAALVLLAACAVCERLIGSQDVAVWILGIIVTLRTINLIRGDLANIAGPTALAAIAWLMLFGGTRSWRVRRSGRKNNSDA